MAWGHKILLARPTFWLAMTESSQFLFTLGCIQRCVVNVQLGQRRSDLVCQDIVWHRVDNFWLGQGLCHVLSRHIMVKFYSYFSWAVITLLNSFWISGKACSVDVVIQVLRANFAKQGLQVTNIILSLPTVLIVTIIIFNILVKYSKHIKADS